MTFLFQFSYVLLFHFDPLESDYENLHPAEILVIIAVSCMFIEEIRIVKTEEQTQIQFIVISV